MSRRVQQLQPSGHTVFPITGMSCFIDGWISTEASMRHSATYYYPNQCPCLGRFMMAVREVLRGKWSRFWTAGEGDGLWISRWAYKQLAFRIKVGFVNTCSVDWQTCLHASLFSTEAMISTNSPRTRFFCVLLFSLLRFIQVILVPQICVVVFFTIQHHMLLAGRTKLVVLWTECVCAATLTLV